MKLIRKRISARMWTYQTYNQKLESILQPIISTKAKIHVQRISFVMLYRVVIYEYIMTYLICDCLISFEGQWKRCLSNTRWCLNRWNTTNRLICFKKSFVIQISYPVVIFVIWTNNTYFICDNVYLGTPKLLLYLLLYIDNIDSSSSMVSTFNLRSFM